MVTAITATGMKKRIEICIFNELTGLFGWPWNFLPIIIGLPEGSSCRVGSGAWDCPTHRPPLETVRTTLFSLRFIGTIRR